MALTHLRLVRRITAGPGGWAGDGPVWDVDNPPVPSQDPMDPEEGSPIFTIGLRRPQYGGATRAVGCKGILRVIGADSTRRFTMRLVVEWPQEGLSPRWMELVDSETGTIVTPRDIGDDEDFTTADTDLATHRVAFHLTPIAGNLGDGSMVEIWAVVI